MNILVYGANKAQSDLLKSKGCKIITSAKQFWYLANTLDTINAFITYVHPDVSSLLKNMVSKALDKGATVKYYKCIGASPIEITDVRYQKVKSGPYEGVYSRTVEADYDFFASFYEKAGIEKLTEQQEQLTRKFLPFYDMKFPDNNMEWIESYLNIKFCLEHKVEYCYDKNRYYECPNCGNLVARHLESTHDCELAEYDNVTKVTAIDLQVNGII